MRSRIRTALKGFLMGAADVVPGVSGGTMAFILGIYARLLRAISAFDLTLLRLVMERQWRGAIAHCDLVFLLWLGAGIGAALVFFTRVVPLPRLIVSDPVPIYALFFGLILASAALLLRSVGDLGARDAVCVAAGTALGFGVVNLVPFATPETWWFVMFSGAIAISAMILPGISGSFILLILRKYAYVFDAIGRFDLSVIVPFGIGIVLGLMAFSRALYWLIEHHYRPALTTITGLLIGSLWVIWPFQDRVYETVRGKQRLLHSGPVWPDAFSAETAVAVLLAGVGVAAVFAIERLARDTTER